MQGASPTTTWAKTCCLCQPMSQTCRKASSHQPRTLWVSTRTCAGPAKPWTAANKLSLHWPNMEMDGGRWKGWREDSPPPSWLKIQILASMLGLSRFVQAQVWATTASCLGLTRGKVTNIPLSHGQLYPSPIHGGMQHSPAYLPALM